MGEITTGSIGDTVGGKGGDGMGRSSAAFLRPNAVLKW
jgi:hypothetical protein